jgi:small-conductance mechanosensitive channel
MNWALLDSPYFFKLTASVVLIVASLAIRTVIIRAILRETLQSEIRRRWVVSVRNATWLIITLGLAAVWAEAIESFGTAILAVAVAFVLATKELIQGVMGNFVRTTTNMYGIGDRIEIDSHRGDVVDLNLFSTTILEVGPGPASHLRTGRTVIIPNSRLLDTIVVNESSMKQYVVHSFTVPVSLKDDWKKCEELLLQAAEEECAPFLEEAREHMARLEREHGLRRLPLKPRVIVELSQPDRVNLIVRVPAPVGRQGTLEQAILRRYLDGGAWKELENGPGEPVSSETLR